MSPSKFTCRSPNPQCDSIWRRSLWEIRFRWCHEGWLPRWDQCPYKRKWDQSSVLLSANEDIARSWSSASQEEPSPGTCTLSLDFSSSQTVRKKCLFQPPRLWYFVTAAQTKTYSNVPSGVGSNTELCSCPHVKTCVIRPQKYLISMKNKELKNV